MLLVLLAARPVHAQTMTIYQAASLPRLDAQGQQIQKRPQTLNPEGVSLQDCRDDQRIRFTIQLQGFAANASFEAWAGLSGNDCSAQTSRTGPAATCWPIASGIPLQLQTNIDVPVRKIMAGVLDPRAPNESPEVCGQVNLTNITVNFLYFAPGQTAAPATRAHIDVKVDTIGPPPLSGVEVLPGDTRLSVRWTSVGEGGVQDLTGVRVYCAPAGGGGAPTTTVCDDAGGGTDPDAGDGGCVEVPVPESDSGVAACSRSDFRMPDASTDDIIPDNAFNELFQCGQFNGNTGAGANADSLRGAPLQNDTTYAVAVAATDAFGNVGELSSVRCEKPELTTDFWRTYKEAGGDAGGGYCATNGPGAPAGSAAALGVVAFAAMSVVRRRQARRAARDDGAER